MPELNEITLFLIVNNFIGFLAFLCGLIALSQKSELRLRALACTGSLLWAGYFWLTGSYTASIIAIVIAIRLLAAYKLLMQPRNIKILAMVAFQIITILITYLTWKGLASLAVWLAASLATYGYFLITGVKLRFLLIVVDSCWLLHDALTFNIMHAIATILQIGLNIRMTFKLKKG